MNVGDGDTNRSWGQWKKMDKVGEQRKIDQMTRKLRTIPKR